jgi:hypothetical protein
VHARHRVAIQGVVDDLRALGHNLRLSDLFRSYEMQRQANLEARYPGEY